MSSREETIINETINIVRKYLDPQRIFLFGSRAKGTNTPNADFDFAVEGKKYDITLNRRIKDEIDAVAGLYSVDVVYMDSVKDGFKEIILETGKIIYEKRN